MTDDHAIKPGLKGEVTKLDVLRFPESICHRCANSRTVATKASKFLLCGALAAKYPRQPVFGLRGVQASRGPARVSSAWPNANDAARGPARRPPSSYA